jgi:hypothetical protein
MTSHPLDGAYERVRRAEEHMLEIDAFLAKTRDEQFNFTIRHWDENRFDFDVGKMVLPNRIRIFIGETSYNLRSALDYLVAELSGLDCRAVQDMTQFPIEDRKRDFYRRVNGYLKGLNNFHVAALERLQPYNGNNWLKRLQRLSNVDKHRSLIELQDGTSHDLTVGIGWYTTMSFDIKNGPVRSAIWPETGEVVYVQMHGPFRIRLADGTPLMEALEILKSQVTQTLDAFKSEFKVT